MADHASSVDSVQRFHRQDMGRDISVYLHAMFAAAHDRMAGFRSTTSNIVETRGATLRKDLLSILTHLDDRLPTIASEPSVTTSSSPWVLMRPCLRRSPSYSSIVPQ